MGLEDSGAPLQAQLLCGLLNESILGGSQDTAFSKRRSSIAFIKFRDSRQYLSSESLEECIRSYVRTRISTSYRPFQSVQVASWIQCATSFIRSALPSTYLEGLLNAPETDLNSLFTISVLLACQILRGTPLEDFETRAESPYSAALEDIQPLQLADYLLRRTGWFTQQIANMQKITSFRYYFSFCRNQTKCAHYQQQGRQRFRCTGDEGQKHIPKHTLANCSCNHLDALPPKSCFAILSNNITLCRFQTGHGGRLSLVVQPLDDLRTTPYIAISHVRSAGLGNSHGNSLPSCQVGRLQGMVDEISKKLGMGTDTLFWIDTLCLPSTRSRESVASTPWRHIFSMAKAVLVLDPPLYDHSFVRSQEALTLIRNSCWKKRLWTLEEGSAAQHLFFQFSNGTVTLESLLADVEEHYNKAVVLPTQHWYLANDLPGKQALHRLAEHLADDLQALKGRFRDTPETAGLDKEKLKRILRLGYLSNPIFRYFVEEDECKGISSIRAPLIEVYGGRRHEDQRSTGSGHDLVGLLGRLTLINSTALPEE